MQSFLNSSFFWASKFLAFKSCLLSTKRDYFLQSKQAGYKKPYKSSSDLASSHQTKTLMGSVFMTQEHADWISLRVHTGLKVKGESCWPSCTWSFVGTKTFRKAPEMPFQPQIQLGFPGQREFLGVSTDACTQLEMSLYVLCKSQERPRVSLWCNLDNCFLFMMISTNNVLPKMGKLSLWCCYKTN